jgi:hypothetical protein
LLVQDSVRRPPPLPLSQDHADRGLPQSQDEAVRCTARRWTRLFLTSATASDARLISASDAHSNGMWNAAYLPRAASQRSAERQPAVQRERSALCAPVADASLRPPASGEPQGAREGARVCGVSVGVGGAWERDRREGGGRRRSGQAYSCASSARARCSRQTVGWFR